VQRVKNASPVVALLIAVAAVGCDRCTKKTVDAPDAGATLVVMTPDGGTTVQAAVITEALASKVAGPVPTTKLTGMSNPLSVECKSPGQPVSPTIFGIAFADADKDLGATAHRWGGNTTSRYNPKLDAWSTTNN
jgi:hypothetical protein